MEFLEDNINKIIIENFLNYTHIEYEATKIIKLLQPTLNHILAEKFLKTGNEFNSFYNAYSVAHLLQWSILFLCLMFLQ